MHFRLMSLHCVPNTDTKCILQILKSPVIIAVSMKSVTSIIRTEMWIIARGKKVRVRTMAHIVYCRLVFKYHCMGLSFCHITYSCNPVLSVWVRWDDLLSPLSCNAFTAILLLSPSCPSWPHPDIFSYENAIFLPMQSYL